MTISQSSSSPGCNARAALQPASATAFGRLIFLALARWRERRRARADLARLAEAGDYLLRDVGLDPLLTRQDPAAALEEITRRR
ncbi:MAG TPA: hypothetical protein VGF43_07215 [Dongiaceae bacterium]|jgi:uncharacterized protein YjiS (DUF1127 family)